MAHSTLRTTTNHAFGPPSLKLGSVGSGRTSYRDGSMLSTTHPAAKASSISFLRYPPRPLIARFGVREAEQEQPTARLQDRPQPPDVLPPVLVAEDVEQPAVDHAV